MMNIKYQFFAFFIFIFFFACERDKSLLQPNTFKPVVSLSKGNIFYYHFYNGSDVVIYDWFKSDQVTGDTLINNINYSILDKKKIERADTKRLYSYINGKEVIKLDYAISKGDIITFLSKSVNVDSIKEEDVFCKNQIVIYVSNNELDSDTLVLGKYTPTFGILSYFERYLNFVSGYELSGALIYKTKYGQIYQ
jgi:hypothetical protein